MRPGRSPQPLLDAGFNGKLLPPFGIARVRRLDLVRIGHRRRERVCRPPHRRLRLLRAGTHAGTYAESRPRFPLPSRGATGRRCQRRSCRARRRTGRQLALTGLGHAHLDMAWLWPIRETRRKAHRTFRAQLDLLDTHPDLWFGASQLQQFAWVEADDPEGSSSA